MKILFIGLTVSKGCHQLTPEDMSELRAANILWHETEDEYVLYRNSVTTNEEHLGEEDIAKLTMERHELHNLQGCLRRMPAALYDKYNDNFGFHCRNYIPSRISVKPKPKPIYAKK